MLVSDRGCIQCGIYAGGVQMTWHTFTQTCAWGVIALQGAWGTGLAVQGKPLTATLMCGYGVLNFVVMMITKFEGGK